MTLEQKQAHFQEHYHELFAYVYRYVRWRLTDPDETADVVSEIFLQAYAALDGYEPHRGVLRQWLTGIMRHQLAQYWRSHRLVVSLEELTDAMLGSIESLITSFDAQQFDHQTLVNTILDELPLPVRRLVLLHYIDGLTYEEIATLTSKKPATIRKFFSRLHTNLQQQYQHLETIKSIL